MKFIATTLAFGLLAGGEVAAPEKYTLDTSHSQIVF